MTEQAPKPVLQKPPGYRDPNAGRAPNVARPAAPRKPVLPPSFYQKKKRRSFCRSCCCCCCIMLAVIVILLGCGAAFIYVWYDPKLPEFHLQGFRVPKFDVHDSPDGASITARTSATIEMRNRSGKMAYYYGDTDVDINVGQGGDETSVGSTRVPGFKQKAGNTTRLKVETEVRNEVVDDAVAKRLAWKFKSRDLAVSVVAKTKVGLGFGGVKIGMLGVNLRCGGVSMSKLDSAAPKCSINFLKWITIKN